MRTFAILLLAIAAAFGAARAPAQEKQETKEAPRYSDLRRIGAVHGDAAAATEKAQVCSGCHGANGIAIAPVFPNLAGQSAEFLYWRLVVYKLGTVPESAMTPMVATLEDADLRNLATYFAHNGASAAGASAPAAPAAPQDSGDAARIARGERLFFGGDAARGVPPCQGCHGADARGWRPAKGAGPRALAFYRTWPALRGQNAPYLVGKLQQYRAAQWGASSNGFIMQGVAARMDDESIEAIAAWLASLAPQAPS